MRDDELKLERAIAAARGIVPRPPVSQSATPGWLNALCRVRWVAAGRKLWRPRRSAPVTTPLDYPHNGQNQ